MGPEDTEVQASFGIDELELPKKGKKRPSSIALSDLQVDAGPPPPMPPAVKDFGETPEPTEIPGVRDTYADRGDPGGFIRKETIASLPHRFVMGTAKSYEDIKAMISDQEAEALTVTRGILERIANGETYKPYFRNPGKPFRLVPIEKALNAPDPAAAAKEEIAALDERFKEASESTRKARKVSEAYAIDIKDVTPPDETFFEKAAGTVAESGAATVGALATGAITRSPAAAIAVGSIIGGGTAAGSAYEEAEAYAKKKGITIAPEDKLRLATMHGIAEAAGEGIALKVGLKLGLPFFERVAKAMGAESTSEMATEIMQKAADQVVYKPDMTLKDFLYDVALAGTAGAMGGAVIAGGGHGIQALDEKVEAAREERALGIAIDELIASEDPALLSPEEMAVRSLEPSRGVPLVNPTESLKYLIKNNNMERAAEVSGRMAAIEGQEPPVLVAKRAMEEGEITNEQFVQYRRAVIQKQAQDTKTHMSQLIGLEAETMPLEDNLRKAADEVYVPNDREVSESELAKNIELEVSKLPEQDGISYLLDKVPNDTMIGQVFRGMILNPPNRLSLTMGSGGWSNYELYEYRQLTRNIASVPLKLAHYYRVMAERQVNGIYPFAAGAIAASDPSALAPVKGSFINSSSFLEDPETMPMGTSVVSMTDHVRSLHAAQIMDSWLKEIAPSMRIIIVGQTTARRMGHDMGPASGTQFGVGPGTGVLAIDETLEEAEFVQTLAHEFGHFLGDQILGKMPEHVQRAVLKAWGKDVRSRMNTPMREALFRQRGPVNAARFGFASTTKESAPVRDAINNSMVRGYLLSFEEWKAHQMERMLTTGKLNMDKPVIIYFKKYAATIKKFFDKFGDIFSPTKVYEDYIKLGALREQQKLLHLERLVEANLALAKYGMDDVTSEEFKDLNKFLEATFTKVGLPIGLREEIRQSGQPTQERMAEAVKRIGVAETMMLSPEQDGLIDAESYVTGLEDAWLPGQPIDVLKTLIVQDPEVRVEANSGMPRSKAASRITSYIRHTLKYSPHFRGKFTPDTSGYESHLDKYSWYMKWIYSLEQIVKVNPHIKQLSDYLTRVREWARDRMAWITRADQRLQQWKDLTTEENELMVRFMIDQTLEGKYFNLQDPAVIQKYPLNPRTLEMYNRIKSDFEDFISAIEATLVASASTRLTTSPFAASAEIRRIQDRFNELKKKPYFPLSRFGDYLVIVRATRHVRIKGKLYQPGEVMHFEAFDTDFARMAEVDRIKGMYPSGDVKLDVASEAVKTLMSMPQPIIEALKTNPNIALTPDQKRALDEYLYKIAPGQSFVKHLIQRKGTEGYSEDAMRAYANYFFHGASHLARIKYSEPLAETIRNMDVVADTLSMDSTKRRLLANYMRRHFDYIMHPENDWAALRASVAVAYLAGVLKTAVVNLSQVPMVTYPHLAAKYGDVKAIAALQKAYGDSLAMYHVTKPLTKEEEEAITRWSQGLPPQPGDEKIIKHWSHLSTSERQMLRQAMVEGWIDESQAMELAAMSEGSWLTRFKATSKAGEWARWFSHNALIPFQLAEKVNRRVTAISAFRLAEQTGANFDEAYAAAREAVSATQYEYAKWNRAELLRGKKGVFFMFWQYTLNTLFFATGGDKGWWRWWAMMLAAAGAMGLPFAQNLMDLATWALTRWKGDRVNVTYELRKLSEQLAEVLHVSPDLLLHGISRYGFGLIPFADLSGSLGMGRIIPGTELLASANEKFSEKVLQATTEVGGATSALAMRMIQAASQDDPDVLRRIERGMPITLGQQILTAFRWYRNEANETLNGADLTKFDVNDPWQLAEIVGKGLFGLQPRSIAEGRQDEGQPGRDEMLIRQDFANYYRVRREMLLRKLDHEMEHGDSDSIGEVREAIKQFNEDIPSKSLAITNQQIIRMRREKEKARTLQERGDAPQKMYRDLYNKVEDREL